MKISITRALSEIKLLEKKINKKISEFTPTAVVIGKKSPLGFESIDKFKEAKKAEFQSIQDLIKRRSELKMKIVFSNATTKVTVAGVELSVAECIDYKTSIVPLKTELGASIVLDYNRNAKGFEQEEIKLRASIDKQLEAVFGRDKKVTSEEIETITKPYIENNGPILVDSIDCKKQVDEINEWVNTFTLEVDHILSESNATTFIDIED